VILLDEGRHMAQRKLMLPAFHGEKMQRLSGLMAEVAEREVASWPRDEPIELHPRLQAVTLEVILRAVFGLDPGSARCDPRPPHPAARVRRQPGQHAAALQVALAGRGRWARFDRVRPRPTRCSSS
jgi:cytochrome P450